MRVSVETVFAAVIVAVSFGWIIRLFWRALSGKSTGCSLTGCGSCGSGEGCSLATIKVKAELAKRRKESGAV